MGSKSNVIPMPEPERDLDRRIKAIAKEYNDLLYERMLCSIAGLKDAEEDCLRRLREYTPQDRLLNLKEAAGYLGFKPRTLRDWCAGLHPILQHSLIGGELRFRKAWLDAAVERRSVGPKKIKL